MSPEQVIEWGDAPVARVRVDDGEWIDVRGQGRYSIPPLDVGEHALILEDDEGVQSRHSLHVYGEAPEWVKAVAAMRQEDET